MYNAGKLLTLQSYQNTIHIGLCRFTSSGDPSAENVEKNSKSTYSPYIRTFQFFNEYSGVLIVVGGVSLVLFAAGASDLWSKTELKMAKITFEKEIFNLKTKLEAEQAILREKFAAEQTVMREKLAAADLVYEADKNTFQKNVEARVAEAELRASKQFLLYGYSDQYAAYQQKLNAQVKKSGLEKKKSDPGETKQKPDQGGEP